MNNTHEFLNYGWRYLQKSTNNIDIDLKGIYVNTYFDKAHAHIKLMSFPENNGDRGLDYKLKFKENESTTFFSKLEQPKLRCSYDYEV